MEPIPFRVSWLVEAQSVPDLTWKKRVIKMRQLIKLASEHFYGINTKIDNHINTLRILLEGETKFGILKYIPSSYKRKSYAEFNHLITALSLTTKE